MHALSRTSSSLRFLALAVLPWPTLEQLNRYAAPFQQVPEYFWLSLVVGLFFIVMMLAKARQEREQALYSEEAGWNFSKDWSPIGEEDWQQLSQNSNLASLSLARNRKDFTWGTHLGVTFAMFDAPGGSPQSGERRTPETMIAFQKPSDLPATASAITGGGISAWERFVTHRWVFLRPRPPRWVARGTQAKSFVEESYSQLRGI
jgi:hypothetical protein